jgi:hypothetical protein
VGALGHYLEQEGVATVQISLVREHTEALAPPRALWVPFMLGRPFGIPRHPEFQRDVLLAALRLLERENGPIIEDYPHDAPYDDLGAEPEGLVCPVSFPGRPSQGTLGEQLAAEVEQLGVWHDLAVRHRGRTTLGVTGLGIDALAAYVAAWLADSPPAPFRADLAHGDALKLACDELKAYYYEAKSVQPGRHGSAAIQRWFWHETAAGQAFVALREKAAQSTDPSMKPLALISLVPRAVDTTLQTNASIASQRSAP